MKKRTANQEAEHVLPPIVGEDSAALARRLNTTLWQHLPNEKRERWPHDPAEERSLAILGARNCLRRINLNDPNDVLDENAFAAVAGDLLEAVDGVSVNKSAVLVDLRQFQAMGLLVSRYRVLAGTEQNPLVAGLHWTPQYSSQGELQTVELGGWGGVERETALSEDPPPIPPFISPVTYYRERGLLLETVTVGSAQYRRSIPLFCFSQIDQFLRIRLAAYTSVNLLTVSPRQYRTIRNRVLPAIKKHLEEIGTPRFCANPACQLPLVNDPRNRYGNGQCQKSHRESRKNDRKKRRK